MSRAAKPPAMQFYVGDWMRDAAVRQCSPATRGIWFDVLCLMHDNGRTGILEGTVESLARATACTPDEFRQALEEVSVTSVGHVTLSHNHVTLENRRMAREFRERNAARKRKQRQRLGEQPPPTTAKRGGKLSTDVTQKSRPYSSSSTSNTYIEGGDLSEQEQLRLQAIRGNYGAAAQARERGRRPGIDEQERTDRDLREWYKKRREGGG